MVQPAHGGHQRGHAGAGQIDPVDGLLQNHRARLQLLGDAHALGHHQIGVPGGAGSEHAVAALIAVDGKIPGILQFHGAVQHQLAVVILLGRGGLRHSRLRGGGPGRGGVRVPASRQAKQQGQGQDAHSDSFHSFLLMLWIAPVYKIPPCSSGRAPPVDAESRGSAERCRGRFSATKSPLCHNAWQGRPQAGLLTYA